MGDWSAGVDDGYATEYTASEQAPEPKPVGSLIPRRAAKSNGVAPGSEYRWMDSEGARTPIRFQDRVLLVFRSPQNINYLRGLFAKNVPAGGLRQFAVETLWDAIYNYDRARDLLDSDSTALRGHATRSMSMWSEVRRLNHAFYADRMRLFREQAALIEKGSKNGYRLAGKIEFPSQTRDGISESSNDYAYMMFEADSLRPPGLEHLNTPGPLYALREDQVNSERKEFLARDYPPEQFGPRTGAGREKYTIAPKPNAINSLSSALEEPGVSREDAAWSEGNANRSPSQALAEYYGEGVEEASTLGAQSMESGKSYGDIYSWGDKWQENGGTRFERYPTVPFWRRGGREGYDPDFDETAGTGEREMDGQVRKFDMTRMRDPAARIYRRFGPRSGGALD